jgi:hypothetical protein
MCAGLLAELTSSPADGPPQKKSAQAGIRVATCRKLNIDILFPQFNQKGLIFISRRTLKG